MKNEKITFEAQAKKVAESYSEINDPLIFEGIKENEDGKEAFFYDSKQVASRDEMLANARLIATAPELLDALKGLFEHCTMIHRVWGDGSNQKEADAAIAAGKAAIAKAEGGARTTAPNAKPAMDGTHLDWILKGKKEEGEGGVMAGLVKYADWIIGGTILAGWLVIVVVMVLS